MKTAFRQLSVAPAMLLALSILDCQLPTAFCQGTAFTYQGQLQNNGGPASGTYNMTFSVFNTNASGVAIAGPVTNNDVAVSNGLFTVRIDFGPGVFTGEANWLEIGVETNGGSAFTTLTPRQELTPVPYALFANTSSNVSGPVSTAQLSGTVLDSQLAHSAVTLNAGPGLSGGGRVGLGNAITLTNTGVLGVSGNADITATNVGGAVTLGDTGTSADTANLLVKRDGSGNFSAASITLDGTLTLPSTVDKPDIIYSGSLLLLYNDTNYNSGFGVGAGNLATTGTANTADGYQALSSDTTGSYNAAVGDQALWQNISGSYNTSVGTGSLTANTNGSANTADGYTALFANTSGSANTAEGCGALFSNSSGSNNAANGNNALFSNGIGSYNTATGYAALYSNIGDVAGDGWYNTADGSEALNNNTSGDFNTANGFQALYDNTNGYANTANGGQALYSNTSGFANTANGTSSLFNNTIGSYNTANGDSALFMNVGNSLGGGSGNTATGFEALYENTTGSNNAANGYEALSANTNGHNNTASGANALLYNANGDNNTADGYGALGNSVGGGNTAVGSEAFATYTGSPYALNNNTAIGANTLAYLYRGDNNTAVGWNALDSLEFGNKNIGLGYEAGETVVDGTNDIEIGNVGTAFDNNIIRIGTSQTATYLVGTVYAGGVALTSDRAAKENFTAVDARSVLAKVASLPMTQWNYKTEQKDVQHIGPMAQDFHDAFGLAGTDDKHISVIDEGGVALTAIQGLNQKLEETQEAVKAKDGEIETLKQQNDSLAERLNELEATVKLLASRK